MGRIIHPTDLTATSRSAFEHALWLAYKGRHELVLLHISHDQPSGADWSRFPKVRSTLADWGLIDPHLPAERLYDETGILLTKADSVGTDAAGAVLHYLKTNAADLVVVGTRGHTGLAAWLRQSVSLKLASELKMPVLFVQEGGRGFIGAHGGRIDHVLAPVDQEPDPQLAIDWVAGMTSDWKLNIKKLTALHVGKEAISPPLVLRESVGLAVESTLLSGIPEQEIVSYCEKHHPDLLIMTRAGPERIVEKFLGSTTERVIGEVNCPVLVLHAPSYE